MKKSLLSLVLLAGLLLSGAEKQFELNGEHGLQALIGGTLKSPVKAENVKLVPGMENGKAVFIPSDGSLVFSLDGIGKQPEEGTVVFWLKLDTPMEAVLNYFDRDRLPDGSIGNIGDAYRDLLFSGAPFVPVRISRSHVYAQGIGGNAAYYKRMFPGKWHFFAFTWNGKTKKTASLIDFNYSERENRNLKLAPFGKELAFGSANRKQGLNGSIDNFIIYDKALSREELLDLYAKHRPLDAELHDYALNTEKNNLIRLRFRNFSKQKMEKNIRFEILGPDGTKKADNSFRVTAGPGGFADVRTSFRPEKAGLHQLVLDTGRVFELLALDKRSIRSRMKAGELRLTLLEEMDLTRKLPKEKFLSDGTDKVVSSPAGRYRESSNADRSAFTCRLNKLRHPNRYHILEIEYPDDAKRAFSVTLFAERFGITMSGQMNGTAIFTGGEHPVTGTMQKRRLLWLPCSENVALICENYKQRVSEKGGAVARIRVYETQDDLLPKQYESSGDRALGVWDEDIAMDGMWFNMNNLETSITLEFWREKAERMAEYAHHMGYTNWTFQFYDYLGDRNGSFLSMPQGNVPGTNGHVFGWCDVFAKVFERENIRFFGRLGFGFNGKAPMAGFIGEQNLAKDFNDYCARGEQAVERASRYNSFGSGNTTATLNPLHPLFLRNAKRFAAFYRDKYQSNPMFQGITFRESNIIFSLVGLDYGYEDSTIAQFEKETGIQVPVSRTSKTRFAERFRFLTAPERRDAWIRWRCKAFAEVCQATVEELRKGNSRLRLQLWVNCETSMADSVKESFSVRNALLESGYDLKMLSQIDGLEIVPIIRPDFEHIRPDKTRQESYVLYSREFADAFAPRKFRNINMHLHNNLEQYRFTDTKLKEFFWKMGQWSWSRKNFHYGTWANGYPNAQFALLPLTNLLANMDLQGIDLGWWGNPDSGVTDLLRPFYRAFRSIPPGKYRNAARKEDPVALRVCGKNFYLVNRESFPVRVSFRLNSDAMTDLVTRETRKGKNRQFELTVPGQGLLVFASDGAADARITEILQQVRDSDLKLLRDQLLNLDVAVKISHSAQLLRHRQILHDRMEKKQYTEARRYLYRKEVQNALKSLGICQVKGKLLPLENRFLVEIQSLRREPLNAVVNISRTTGCWNVDPRKKQRVANLKTGEKTTLKFDLETPLRKDGWGGEFEVSVSVDGAKPMKYRFLAGGPFAYRTGQREIGSDWSFSRYKMTSHRVSRKNLPSYTYRLGYAWNETGLFLAVDVEDRDFLPPKTGEASFKRDSVQLFLDTRNTAEFSDAQYDGGVFEVVLSQREGKAEIHHSAVPEHGVPAERSGTGLAVKHEKGRTLYECFIPARELPGVEFRNGSVIGACLMVNNILKAGSEGAEVLVTSPDIFPWQRPGTWEDLLLLEEPRPGEEALPPVPGFKPVHRAAIRKTKIDGKECILMNGEGNRRRSGWIVTDPRPVPRPGTVTLSFTARSGGGNRDLWILIRGTDWKGGKSRTFCLSPEWKSYEFQVPGSAFAPETKTFTVDFSMNPGEYQFSDIRIDSKP